MVPCDLAESCWFFHEEMPKLPATSRYMKSTYCFGEFWQCVRYRLHNEVRTPPAGGDRKMRTTPSKSGLGIENAF